MSMSFKKLFFGVGASVLLLLSSLISLQAQENTSKKERRIYLWDVTISMVGATKDGNCPKAMPRTNPDYQYNEGYDRYNSSKDIFDDTRNALVKSIEDIVNEDCEIVVVPYTDKWETPMRVLSASDADKASIISQVKSWNNLHSAGTYTGKCLQEVIDMYFRGNSDGRFNRIILLTDGEAKDKSLLLSVLKEWDKNIKGTKYSDNRLVYVMLTDEAKDDELANLIDNKNKSGDSGLTHVDDLKNLQNLVSFTLSGLNPEQTIPDEPQPSEFSFEVGCNVGMAFGNPEGIRCVFTTEDPLIQIDSNPVPVRNGKFKVRVRYTKSRNEYLSRLGKGVHTAIIKCEVDPTCKDVTLEGNNKIRLDLSANPLPKAIVRISTK